MLSLFLISLHQTFIKLTIQKYNIQIRKTNSQKKRISHLLPFFSSTSNFFCAYTSILLPYFTSARSTPTGILMVNVPEAKAVKTAFTVRPFFQSKSTAVPPRTRIPRKLPVFQLSAKRVID